VRRLHRGDDPGRGQAADVLGIGDLEMLDPPAAVAPICLGQLLIGGDDLGVGRVADRMDRDLEAAPGRFVRLVAQLAVGQELQAPRVGFVGIRLLEPSAARAQCAVAVQLDPADLQPVPVQPGARPRWQIPCRPQR
jgi:hypothetical protein